MKTKQTKLVALFVGLLSANCIVAIGYCSGRTRLHDAANHNDIELLRNFISAGDDVNAKDDNGYTPLHVTAQTANLGTVAAILIEAGADVEAKSIYDNTPLDIAVGVMNPSMKKALIATVSISEVDQGLLVLVAKKMVLAKKYLEDCQLEGLEREITKSFDRVKSKSINKL
jgi:FOG: Ankyrin repeat